MPRSKEADLLFREEYVFRATVLHVYPEDTKIQVYASSTSQTLRPFASL